MGNGESTDFWRSPWLFGSIPIEIGADAVVHDGDWPTVSHFLVNGVWSLPQPENDAMAELFGAISSVSVGGGEDEDSTV